MIVSVQPAWRRRWHLRNLAWGWAHVVVSLGVLAVLVWVVGRDEPWKAWLLLALLPLEALHALSSGILPQAERGYVTYSHEVQALKTELRARADVRFSDDAEMFGGSCDRRWGRDLVLVAPGDFSDAEILAVIAHELGHSKQSVLAKVFAPCVVRMGFASLWLVGLEGAWWMVLAGLATGVYLRVWNLYVHGVWLRRVANAALWAAWWWWFAGQPLLLPVLAACVFTAWHALSALWSRVSELLADEAVVAVHDGHWALSSALERGSVRHVPWWRAVFSTHPHPTRRGARRQQR